MTRRDSLARGTSGNCVTITERRARRVRHRGRAATGSTTVASEGLVPGAGRGIQLRDPRAIATAATPRKHSAESVIVAPACAALSFPIGMRRL